MKGLHPQHFKHGRGWQAATTRRRMVNGGGGGGGCARHEVPGRSLSLGRGLTALGVNGG